MTANGLIQRVDRDQLLFYLAYFGLFLFLLGATGEFLGWWNDIGTYLMSIGLFVLALVLTYLFSATKGQVRGVLVGVEHMTRQLGTMDRKLDRLESMDNKLDALVEGQSTTNGLLRDILGELRRR